MRNPVSNEPRRIEATAEPTALVAEAEHRARRAGGRLSQRAAECSDPELRGLLARAGEDHRRSAERTGSWRRGDVAHPRRAAYVPPPDRTRENGPRLRERHDVSPDLMILKVGRPRNFTYRPGQHVKFGLPGILRTYSLASAPHQPHLEFFVELVPGGALSARLCSAQPGTEVAVAPRAKGAFCLDRRLPNHLMVATVTGVAPYLSVLRDHFHAGRSGQRFIVLQGASHADEFGYREELEALAARHPAAVAYVPTVSRPNAARNAAWTGATGRVDAHALTAPARYRLSPQDTAVYACGNAGMVDAVAESFAARGFRVYTERYD